MTDRRPGPALVSGTTQSGSEVADSARLERAARDVLAQLDPYDLDRVLAAFNTVDDLLRTMVHCAERVRGHVAVPPEQDELLLLATLTPTRRGAGVHRNPAHAARRLKLFLRVPGIAIPVAFLLGSSDSVQFILALDSAYRADDMLAATREEPRVFVTMVAVAAACIDAANAADVAPAVLDRGMELAATYQASDAPLPRGSLPVLGDRGFLVQLAGYAQAVRERRGADVTADPQAGVAERVCELEERILQAVTRPPRFPLDESDGPDQAFALLAAAGVIGGDTGDEAADGLAEADDSAEAEEAGEAGEAGEADDAGGPAGVGDRDTGGVTARSIFRRLNRGLWHSWLGRADWVAPTDLEDLPRRTGSALEPLVLDKLAYVDDLTARIVGLLTTRAGRAECARVAEWVCGRRKPDVTDDLYSLVLRLRRLMLAIEGPALLLDPPLEPDAPVLRAMVTAVRGKIEAQLVIDPHRREPGELTAGVLAPLWTARGPVIRALTQQIKRDEQWDTPRKRRPHTPRILAARAVRGPGQIVRDTTQSQHDHGRGCATVQVETSDLDMVTRCNERVSPFEPDRVDICPARPWGERGRVESRATIADLSRLSHEAVRGHLDRYAREGGGPWWELAEADRP